MAIRFSYAEMQLMIQAFNAQDPGYFNTRPMPTSLLPEKQVVVIKAKMPDGTLGEEDLLVVSNQRAAAATWPIVGCGKDLLVKFDKDVKRIRWVTIDDVKMAKVQPTKAISPKHVNALKQKGSTGIKLMRVGAPVPLLKWQCSRAFAGVPGATLKCLAKQVGAPILNLNDASIMEEDKMACEIILQLEDAMSQEKLHEMLQYRKWEAESSLCAMWDEDMTQDILDDVMLQSDRKDCLNRKTEHKEQNKQM